MSITVVFAQKGIMALNMLKSAVSACSLKKVSLPLLKSAVSAGKIFFPILPLLGAGSISDYCIIKVSSLGTFEDQKMKKIEGDVFWEKKTNFFFPILSIVKILLKLLKSAFSRGDPLKSAVSRLSSWLKLLETCTQIKHCLGISFLS